MLIEKKQSIQDIGAHLERPFVPLSKGGGDIRYYMNNGFIIWWNEHSCQQMLNLSNTRLQNLGYFGLTNIIWSFISGKPRGRFCIAQKGLGTDVSSMNIIILENSLNKYTILSYLNSKFCNFFGRIQTKSRMWQAGIIARFPIPFSFLIDHSNELSNFAKESFLLRRDWDLGYPMSPIFAESLIDKIIDQNKSIQSKYKPKTGHPFCAEYQPCTSNTAQKINETIVLKSEITIHKLLNTVEQRFNLLTHRLDEIDDEINQILYQLIDEPTAKALDEYYNTFVGELGWEAERDIWLKDFLMANLIEIIKNFGKGGVLVNQPREGAPGLYETFIDLLCTKFDRTPETLQPILSELKELLGKDLKHWICEDFFFYHCQRFGGRPIIWQFKSRSKGNSPSVIDFFIHYHTITENTLPNIRVEYLEPILKVYKQRIDLGTLPVEDVPKHDEIEDMIKAFEALETGYPEIPTPNTLTNKNAARGKGDDQTWAWVFGEAQKIIEHGYRPDQFKGVLVNIIPLCLDLPEARQKTAPIKYRAICPKGTLKYVLKKIDALDQLRNKGSKDAGGNEDEDNEGENGESENEGSKKAKKPKSKSKKGVQDDSDMAEDESDVDGDLGEAEEEDLP